MKIEYRRGCSGSEHRYFKLSYGKKYLPECLMIEVDTKKPLIKLLTEDTEIGFERTWGATQSFTMDSTEEEFERVAEETLKALLSTDCPSTWDILSKFSFGSPISITLDFERFRKGTLENILNYSSEILRQERFSQFQVEFLNRLHRSYPDKTLSAESWEKMYTSYRDEDGYMRDHRVSVYRFAHNSMSGENPEYEPFTLEDM